MAIYPPEHRPSYFRAILEAIRREYRLRQMRKDCRADRYITEDGMELARKAFGHDLV